MKTMNQLINMKNVKIGMNTDANSDVAIFWREGEGEDVLVENLGELHFLHPHNQ